MGGGARGGAEGGAIGRARPRFDGAEHGRGAAGGAYRSRCRRGYDGGGKRGAGGGGLRPGRDLMVLSTGAGRLEVHIDRGAGADTTAEEYVDAAVRIRGLAAGFINDRRQLVEPHLRVGAIGDVAIEQAPRPLEELPVMSAERLVGFLAGAGARPPGGGGGGGG